MITFIIPLKAPEVCHNWNIVSKLAERAIKSACNQTSDLFRVVVVCNRKPELDFDHPHLHFIKVDFPLPAQQLTELGLEKKVDFRGPDVFAKDIDKGRKILTGLSYAKQLSYSHAMVVDADDCINKNIAEFVNSNSSSVGWYLRKGYLYHEHRNFLQAKFKDFYKTCGTSIIMKVEHFDKLFKYQHVYEHRIINFSDTISLKPFPLFGAIYSVGNTENIFQTIDRQNYRYKKYGLALAIKNLFRSRSISDSIRDEFSFYCI